MRHLIPPAATQQDSVECVSSGVAGGGGGLGGGIGKGDQRVCGGGVGERRMRFHHTHLSHKAASLSCKLMSHLIPAAATQQASRCPWLVCVGKGKGAAVLGFERGWVGRVMRVR
jgi:hypothetical protein